MPRQEVAFIPERIPRQVQLLVGGILSRDEFPGGGGISPAFFCLDSMNCSACKVGGRHNARVTSTVTLNSLHRKASGSHGSSKKIRFDDYMNQLHK